jgi:hypothetical protein
MIRRSVLVLMFALAGLLALSGAVSADHGDPHGGGCRNDLPIESCGGAGGGGNDRAGGGGSGGRLEFGEGVFTTTGGGGLGGNDKTGLHGGGGGCFVLDGERQCSGSGGRSGG